MLEPVSLDQLRVLIAIADSGSFSAAARRLRRAQSAVSHAVQSLETALGLSLFDRKGRRPQLTEAGRNLLADSRAVVSRTEQLRARARSMAEGVEPELGLAVDVMFPHAVLIESVRALGSAYPHLPITVHSEALGVVDMRVREGSVRLGISPNFEPGADDGLERRFLTDIAMVTVAAADHPLARIEGTIPLPELERHVQLVLSDRDWLVARAQGQPVSSAIRGVVSPQAWRFADLSMRRDFLLAGLGFCNMPLHLVEDDLAAGRLKQLEVEGWGPFSHPLPVHIVLRRGREPGPAACWLIRDLEQRFGGRGEGKATTPTPPSRGATRRASRSQERRSA